MARSKLDVEQQRRTLSSLGQAPTTSIPVLRTEVGVPRLPRIIPLDDASFRGAVEFGSLLSELGRRLNDVTSRAADAAAAEEGRREGTRIGAVGEFQRRSPVTIKGRAFNQAILQSYADRVQLSMRQRITEISERHPADPEAFRQEAEGFVEGFRQELPDELRGPFDLQAHALVASERTKKRAIFQQQVADEQAALYLELEDKVIRQAAEEAPFLFDADEEVSAAALDSITAGAAELERHLEQTGPDGLPLFSFQDQMKRRLEFRDRVLVSGVRSAMRHHPDPARALGELVDGQLRLAGPVGTMIDVRSNLQPEKFEQLLNAVQGDLRERVSLADAQERRLERAIRQGRDDAERALTVGILAGETGTSDILAAGDAGLLSATGVRNLERFRQAMIDRGDKDIDDRRVRFELEDTIRFEDTDPVTMRERLRTLVSEEQMQPETATQILGLLDQKREDPRRQRYEYREAQRAIRAAIVTTGPGAQFMSGEQQDRLTAAYREFDRRVIDGGEDPQIVQQDVMLRYRSESVEPLSFPAPRFVPDVRQGDAASIEGARLRLAELELNGEISEAQAREEHALIDRIERTLLEKGRILVGPERP